ncbi:MAG TPA: integrase core domain-containing protein [Candidatus Obscuribacterales bacterium]
MGYSRGSGRWPRWRNSGWYRRKHCSYSKTVTAAPAPETLALSSMSNVTNYGYNPANQLLTEARQRIEEWREDYNTNRPHSSLGYRTPAPARQMYLALAG